MQIRFGARAQLELRLLFGGEGNAMLIVGIRRQTGLPENASSPPGRG